MGGSLLESGLGATRICPRLGEIQSGPWSLPRLPPGCWEALLGGGGVVAGKTDPSRWGYRASPNSAGWGGAKPLLSPLG